MHEKLESDIKAVDMKYAKEKQHKMDKAQKEQAEFQKQFDTLTKGSNSSLRIYCML